MTMPVAIGPDGTEDGAENTPTTTTKKKKKMMKMHITTQIFLLFQLPDTDTDTDTDTCRRSLGASASLGL